MTLAVDVSLALGAFSLEARFESAGRVVALFGPSGSGKTTLVNLIGGLLRPARGRIEAGGRVLVDTERRVFLPPHRRRIGYVFQEPRLFPHLSVRGNLVYGRWFTPPAERREDFGRVVDLLGIGHLLERRPGALSGGERQRVGIGRALLSSPLLLLMDEPLASLDEARKAEIMPYIERLRDETMIPIVYVSHSVAEVARLASDVVLLARGSVAAFGPAADVLARLDLLPEEARGEGGSVLDAIMVGHDEAFDMSVLSTGAGAFRVTGRAGPPGAHLRLRIRARDVMIATKRPEGLSALNVMAGTVSAVVQGAGAQADVRIACGGATIVSRITRQSLQALGLAVGTPVFAVVKSVSLDGANLAAASDPAAASGKHGV